MDERCESVMKFSGNLRLAGGRDVERGVDGNVDECCFEPLVDMWWSGVCG